MPLASCSILRELKFVLHAGFMRCGFAAARLVHSDLGHGCSRRQTSKDTYHPETLASTHTRNVPHPSQKITGKRAKHAAFRVNEHHVVCKLWGYRREIRKVFSELLVNGCDTYCGKARMWSLGGYRDLSKREASQSLPTSRVQPQVHAMTPSKRVDTADKPSTSNHLHLHMNTQGAAAAIGRRAESWLLKRHRSSTEEHSHLPTNSHG